MRITSLTISNFRCFASPATLRFDDLTALIGGVAAGKSSTLAALTRLFGITAEERRLVRSDFRLPGGRTWDTVDRAELQIEARIDVPELAQGRGRDGSAAFFRQMTITEPGGNPYCRIRFSGAWVRSSNPEGDIEERLAWVTSPVGTPVADEQTISVLPHDRSRIQVRYIPAARDPAKQIRQVSGSLLHALLGAVTWSTEARAAVEAASTGMRDAFGEEAGVASIEESIGSWWEKLHSGQALRDVKLRPAAKRLEDLLRQVEATFSPGGADTEEGIDRLSDGQKSLFYLSIVGALLAIQTSEPAGFSPERLQRPILTLLAIEEPENHIAPHYLGRIVKALRDIAGTDHGQVVFSSHSPSVLSRVSPREVRHLRREGGSGPATISEIELPPDTAEEYTFVQEAVRAYPELYFASAVVFGEGESEVAILKRLLEASGLNADASLISVVPLGGRHVNHFWKLLRGLGIPYVTLLDLDVGRRGGGWGRIKYVLKQLLANGVDRAPLLAIQPNAVGASQLSEADLDRMHDLPASGELAGWLDRLEFHDVFFSSPLDIDLLMLEAFRDRYCVTTAEDQGPDIPTGQRLIVAQEQVTAAVLKDPQASGAFYTDEQKKLFFWYRYLFLSRGKPTTHLITLSGMSEEILSRDAPAVLKRLAARVAFLLEDVEDEEPPGDF